MKGAAAGAALLVTCLSFAPGLVAQGDARPTLVAGIQAVELSRGSGGGVAFAEALFTLSPATRFSAGLVGGGIGDVRWGFARVGILVQASPGLLATLGADFGAGNQGLDYRHLRAEVSYRPAGSSLVFHVGEQYLDALGAVGNLVSVGVEFHPAPSVRTELTWHGATGGSLVTETATFRLDVELKEGKSLFGWAGRERADPRRSTSFPRGGWSSPA